MLYEIIMLAIWTRWGQPIWDLHTQKIICTTIRASVYRFYCMYH